MPFCGMGAATCVWKLQGGVNNGKVALDALEHARSEREMRKGGGSGCPERKNGSLPPLVIAPWAAKHAGVRGGTNEAVGKSSGLRDLWKGLKHGVVNFVRRCLMVVWARR